MALSPDGRRLACAGDDHALTLLDAVTGKEVGDYSKLSETLKLETTARKAAEDRAREEAEARAALEARVRELEEQVRRRGANGSGQRPAE